MACVLSELAEMAMHEYYQSLPPDLSGREDIMGHATPGPTGLSPVKARTVFHKAMKLLCPQALLSGCMMGGTALLISKISAVTLSLS
jgi:hypothetical protein